MKTATQTTRRHKLIEAQQLIQVLPLTDAELVENADRAARNWAPYVKVCCAHCETVSPFATRDELAVSRWKAIFQPGEAQHILCPTCNQ